MTRLPILIHIVRRELELYDRDSARQCGEPWQDWRQRQQAALAVLYHQVRLLGAAAVVTPTQALVELHGIRTTSGLGMPRALRQWLSVAEGRV